MSSATERPSRAPSTTKSVISATASGWLSLTPRSRRRLATIAAIAIMSLSFSRGVRFIGPRPSSYPSSVQQIPRLRSSPEPRLACAERDNGRDERGAQSGGRRGDEAGDDEAVEGAGAGFDAARSLERR